jgi:hypothetical protein
MGKEAKYIVRLEADERHNPASPATAAHAGYRCPQDIVNPEGVSRDRL